MEREVGRRGRTGRAAAHSSGALLHDQASDTVLAALYPQMVGKRHSTPVRTGLWWVDTALCWRVVLASS